jgi:hypothetical protein
MVMTNDSLRSAATAMEELPPSLQEQSLPTHAMRVRSGSGNISYYSAASPNSSPDRIAMFHDCHQGNHDIVLDDDDILVMEEGSQVQVQEPKIFDGEASLPPLRQQFPCVQNDNNGTGPMRTRTASGTSICTDDDTIAVSNVTAGGRRRQAKVRARRARALRTVREDQSFRGSEENALTVGGNNHNGLRNQRIHLRHGRNFHYTARRHVTAIAAANAIAPVVSSENNSGILIARGFEQWMSVPALLLLCPFAGLVCTLATLDNNDYNWQICVVDRNVRRLVYGFQCGGFSALLFLGIEVSQTLGTY